MADDKKSKFTQAEVDGLIQKHSAAMADALAKAEDAKETARDDGLAEGIMRGAEWLDARADQLEEADKERGFFEAEIAILRWAAKRVGAL